MTEPTATPEVRAFHDALVAGGLLVPTGPLGALGHGPEFEAVIAAFDAFSARAILGGGAAPIHFPPVIDRAILERTGYLESFPHLCGVVHSFAGSEREARAIPPRIAEGRSWGDLLAQTDLVLTPAACYPFYPTCAGTLPPDGRHVTLLGWVFRQEPSLEPTRMRAFRVREAIRVGTPDEVLAWRAEWLVRGRELLAMVGLPVETDVAADPFFGRGGKVMAAGQLEQQLKHEFLVPVLPGEPPTACCSVNYHRDKFAQAFGITLADGTPAHTACMGFGLERVALALLRTHGLDRHAWPAPVRALLWP